MKTILAMALIEGCGMFKVILPVKHQISEFDRAQFQKSSEECVDRHLGCLATFYIKGFQNYHVMCEGKGRDEK